MFRKNILLKCMTVKINVAIKKNVSNYKNLCKNKRIKL